MSELFPPFEPGDEPKTRRFKPVPLRLLLPNLITLLALCSGLTAIRLGIQGRFELAVAAVIVAFVMLMWTGWKYTGRRSTAATVLVGAASGAMTSTRAPSSINVSILRVAMRPAPTTTSS